MYDFYHDVLLRDPQNFKPQDGNKVIEVEDGNVRFTVFISAPC